MCIIDKYFIQLHYKIIEFSHMHYTLYKRAQSQNIFRNIIFWLKHIEIATFYEDQNIENINVLLHIGYFPDLYQKLPDRTE